MAKQQRDEDEAAAELAGHADTDADILTDNTDNDEVDDYEHRFTFLYDNEAYEPEKRETEYATLQIGAATLVVSSDGRIRNADNMFSSSVGFALPGTPYRTFPVEIYRAQTEEYYVHDIVWRAFNGEPPEGWEVRHSFWEPKNGNDFYSNSLENLQIYPSTVTYLPSVRKCLPEAKYT